MRKLLLGVRLLLPYSYAAGRGYIIVLLSVVVGAKAFLSIAVWFSC